MSYHVVIPKPTQKQLDDLPDAVYTRTIEKIDGLQIEPRPQGCVKLKSYKNEYRIRVGDYRVRYGIDDANQTVVLLDCRHREDIYRN